MSYQQRHRIIFLRGTSLLRVKNVSQNKNHRHLWGPGTPILYWCLEKQFTQPGDHANQESPICGNSFLFCYWHIDKNICTKLVAFTACKLSLTTEPWTTLRPQTLYFLGFCIGLPCYWALAREPCFHVSYSVVTNWCLLLSHSLSSCLFLFSSFPSMFSHSFSPSVLPLCAPSSLSLSLFLFALFAWDHPTNPNTHTTTTGGGRGHPTTTHHHRGGVGGLPFWGGVAQPPRIYIYIYIYTDQPNHQQINGCNTLSSNINQQIS